jgi:hypothetical protein
VECLSTIITLEQPLKEAKISKDFQEAKKRELNRIWAKLFYEVNIPFIVSKNKAPKEAMRKTADFRWSYGLPSYHDLCKKFLVQTKEELQAHLQVKMVKSVCKFEATLAING